MTEPKAYKPSALRLIDAAERLIGQYGYDGVSLHQIAAEAGQANKFAVQYHFGSKKGVVDAVFEVRVPKIDARRQVLFDQVMAKPRPTTRDFLFVLFQPVFDEVDAHGEHAYARFAAQIRHLPAQRRAWVSSARLAQEVFEHLRQSARHLSQSDFDMRFSLAIDLFTGAMRLLDERRDYSLSNETPTFEADRLIANALDMCAAGFERPASEAG